MAIPESALLLAGFVLAHAVWSVSDLPKGDLLVPLAIVERNGKRELIRFEADTQEQAIAKGKAYLAEMGGNADSWAFAREGLINEHGQKVDVISVDIWAKGASDRITLIQRFEPFANRNHFRLLGQADVVINGIVQDSAKVLPVSETIRRGIAQHSKASPGWSDWQKP